MKKQLYKLWAKLVTQFGSIKIFKFPLFFVYDPTEYAMDGAHMEKALSILEPGDVVLRGYDQYLDSYFIGDPYLYAHGGLYIGNGQMIHAVAAGVSQVNAIDFMTCDRVCILRPSKHKQAAIRQAKKFLKDNVPYDFGFSRDTSALYCFELCAESYPKFGIERVEIRKLFGLLKKKVYLADSFRKNKNFQIVFEYNKKFGIDTTK